MRSPLPSLLLCTALAVRCSAPTSDFNLAVVPTSVDLFPDAERALTIRAEWSGELPPKPVEVDPRSWPVELGSLAPFTLTPEAPERTLTIHFPADTEPGQRLSPLVARSRGIVKWQVLDFLVRAASGALDRSFGMQGTGRFCDEAGPTELMGMSLDVADQLLLFGRSSSELVIAQTAPSGTAQAVFVRRDVSALDVSLKAILFEKDRSRSWAGAESLNSVLLISTSYDDPFNTTPSVLERKDLKSLGAGFVSTDGVLFAGATRAVPGELAVLRLDRQGKPLQFTAPKSEVAKATLTGDVRPMALFRNATNGRFLVGGSAGNGAFIARFQSNGNLDTSFGQSGVFTLPPLGGEVHEVAEASSGGIWFSGVSRGLAFVGQLTERGALETRFGQGGVIRLVEATFGRVLLAEAPEQGVYAAMSLRVTPTDVDFAVAALTKDGTLKSTFGNAGWRVTPVGEGNDTLMAFEAISNRTLLLGGTTENRCFGLARIWQ
ncbi:MAG: hypothetical protein ACT4TC_26800 [Myxococcaceae bacterium]